ncbi:flippase [Halobaculum sp. EA56]|uniref:flippase n=1 Tax=Halobaculum sp. EA56 TaxID=3421648 RepID=UPI003EB90B30
MDDNNLSRVFSGASVIFAGVILELGIGFAAKVLFARVATPELYGIVIYVHTIVVFLAVIVTFGYDSGIGRYLPRYESQQEKRGLVISIMTLVIPIAALIGLTIYLFSNELSLFIFDTVSYAITFRVLAVAIPLFVFIRLSIGGIQGMKQSVGTVAIKNVTLPVMRLLLISGVAVLGGGLAEFAGAYVIAYGIGAVVAFYFLNRSIPLLSRKMIFSQCQIVTVSKFSAPLVLSTATQRVISRADLLLIGYFVDSASVVGAYDVSLSLAQLLLAVIAAFGYITMPVISELESDDNMIEIRALYSIIAKWGVFSTVPIVLLFFFFPETIISITFGPSYLGGAFPLQILSLAFFTHVVLGPSGNLLKALGKSKQLMKATVGAGIANVLLNIFLIPPYEMVGAATATLVSYVAMNVMVFYYLNQFGVPPATSNDLLTVAVPVMTFGVAYLVAILAAPSNLAAMLLTVSLFASIYFVILLRYFIGDQERRLLFQLSEDYGVPVTRIDAFLQAHAKRYDP